MLKEHTTDVTTLTTVLISLAETRKGCFMTGGVPRFGLLQLCSTRSGSEIGHQLDKELGAGELDGIDFQSVPADKTQEADHGFRWLDAARAALE